MKTAVVLIAFIAIACGAEENANLKGKIDNVKHEISDNINKVVDKVKKDVKADAENIKKEIEKALQKIKNAEEDIEEKIKELVKKIIEEVEKTFSVQCTNSTCTLCAKIGEEHNVCSDLEVDLQDFSITIDLKLNGKIIITKTFRAKNPEPLCVAVPHLTSVKVCLHPYDLSITNDGFHMCMKLEVYGIGKEVVALDLKCITLRGKEFEIESGPKKE